ncbi:hypothetical protein OG742_37320 [Streptomyces sp. NBC_00828]|uniref:hypothetical protein n=1 Tax=Streptomyces sp. NBC_00828 TaxID=2903678 RepID=UPI003868A34A
MTDTDEPTSDTHPATPAVPPAPADRAALREQIAAAIHHDLLATAYRRDQGLLGIVPRLTDAVLAVLPAITDRNAVLREAADALDESEKLRNLTDDHMHDVNAAANELRRMADAAPLPSRVADGAQPATRNPSVITDRVLSEVLAERIRQDGEWGEQNHPDGTGGYEARRIAEDARRNCKAAAERGVVTWLLISDEEHCEALAESDPAKLRAELIQDAAVKVAWVEAIDRRAAAAEEPT